MFCCLLIACDFLGATLQCTFSRYTLSLWLSVCPSVRPSVKRRYFIKTTEPVARNYAPPIPSIGSCDTYFPMTEVMITIQWSRTSEAGGLLKVTNSHVRGNDARRHYIKSLTESGI